MPEKRVFDDNEKQSFENSLVWTRPKTDKEQTKENKLMIYFPSARTLTK